MDEKKTIEQQALEFMIKNKLDKSYAVLDRVFKHKANAIEYSGEKGGAPIAEFEREALSKQLSDAKKTEE
jgi:hypothetical protein